MNPDFVKGVDIIGIHGRRNVITGCLDSVKIVVRVCEM
jgi:hypothetical protein